MRSGYERCMFLSYAVVNPNPIIILPPATAIVSFNSTVVTVSEGVNAVLCVTATFVPPGPGIAELQVVTNDVTASGSL